MAVTHDDVRNVAALARLAVPAATLDALVAELNGILAHMDVLRGVPTNDDALRADGVREGMRVAPDAGPPVPLSRTPDVFAPAWRDGFFLVPRLATHDGAAAAEDEHPA